MRHSILRVPGFTRRKKGNAGPRPVNFPSLGYPAAQTLNHEPTPPPPKKKRKEKKRKKIIYIYIYVNLKVLPAPKALKTLKPQSPKSSNGPGVYDIRRTCLGSLL